jgi:hypothetical protein
VCGDDGDDTGGSHVWDLSVASSFVLPNRTTLLPQPQSQCQESHWRSECFETLASRLMLSNEGFQPHVAC